jgi:hypothetical protein
MEHEKAERVWTLEGSRVGWEVDALPVGDWVARPLGGRWCILGVVWEGVEESVWAVVHAWTSCIGYICAYMCIGCI